MDSGIKEFEFWDMTISEVERAMLSQKRIREREARDRATFDYILADLIGRSVGRIYSSSTNIPDIYTAYPTLFNSQEIEEEKAQRQAELSAIRFRLFAKAHNDKYNQEVAKNK
ncbi:hypothetical protein [uncultured Campylobacter sp.]|uniref:hypothetical protein n=1 Tax=uncultured Campylobacter sp. TaxID=218934 RepID=UPI0026263F60|nr:hypothetical protein [uncultured Campylobacter sp.]